MVKPLKKGSVTLNPENCVLFPDSIVTTEVLIQCARREAVDVATEKGKDERD